VNLFASYNFGLNDFCGFRRVGLFIIPARVCALSSVIEKFLCKTTTTTTTTIIIIIINKQQLVII
jgi:hypothetical protein